MAERPKSRLGGVVVAAPLAIGLALWAAWLFVFAFRTVGTAPQLSNEAELMYEASRMARGLPLYTDPLTGAFDDGPLPIRHYVLYGPLAPWLLSLVGEPSRLIFARSVSVFSWFVGMPALAWITGGTDRRQTALVVALAYSGLFLLARDVVYFTLTPVPMILAAFALVRVVRKGRLDLVACALFALAWALKPLIMGIALGVSVAVLIDRETPLWRRVRSIASFALVVGATIAALLIVTKGAWLLHLRLSTGNGFVPQHWRDYVTDYFPIVGLPHLAVAIWLLTRGRGPLLLGASTGPRASRLTGCVLLVSTLWAIFAMGKRGANVGYFLEPCAALVVAVGYGASSLQGRWRGISTVAVACAPVLSVLLSWPTLRAWSSKDAVSNDWARLRDVKSACESAAPGLQIRSGLPAYELALSGRVTLAPWQHTVLVNNHKFPLEVLVADLDLPALGCLVHSRSLVGEAPEETNATGEFTYYDVLFDVKLRQPIRERFEEFAVVGQLHLYRRRPR